MSTPTTRDPLVVNTKDGAVWQRRAVTTDGRGLYASAGSCPCPETLMTTLAELAVHGIVGQADALPVPGARLGFVLSEQQIEVLAAAGNRVVNDATHEQLCMCDGWPEKCSSTGNYYMGAWDVSGLEDALPAVLAAWEQMRGGEMLRLQARVTELEAERHVTNEVLSDAAEALRASKDQPAPLIVPDADVDTLPAWLYQRFTQDGEEWDSLYPEQREYWVHQARAVGRAVARGGFKSAAGDR